MIQLLDLLPIIERRIPDTSRVLPKPELPDSLPTDTAQAIAGIPGGTQQLADISPIPDVSGLFGANLLGTVIVVLLALCLCFFFIKRYRTKQG